MPIPSAAKRAAVIVALALCASPLAAGGDADLPEGFVRGDVVSYSYVPIHTYRPDEAIGVLPYLWEYYLMKWDGKHPLTHHHAENLRRIDIASQWSTAIMLYARYDEWHDELINLIKATDDISYLEFIAGKCGYAIIPKAKNKQAAETLSLVSEILSRAAKGMKE